MRARRSLMQTMLFVFASWVCVHVSQARADEMSFRSVRLGDTAVCGDSCPNAIAANGQITQETAGRFLSFLQAHGGAAHTVVYLQSPGGSVLGSMQFGTLLRHMGATAVVAQIAPDGEGGAVLASGQCFSACVYALTGARKRVVPAGSEVGIHRMFLVEEGVDANGTALTYHRRSDNSDMRDALMQYSRQMGVNPGLIAEAERIPSNSLKILSRSELRQWHLVSAAR